MVGPHTSAIDFFVGLAARSIAGIPDAHYLGKKELFKPPFGFIFKWLGGTPVDRSARKNMVEQVAEYFQKEENFHVALSPEGTRKKVDKLKTGFYHIAKMAGVPLVITAFDYEKKQVIFSDPFYPTDDMEADFKMILKFLGPVQGKVPGKGMGHLMEE